MNNFEEVFKKYDTDKLVHYSNAYNECFDTIRNDIKLLFEIGVNRGGSVRAFKEYFPNALIVGLEIDGNKYFEEDRIKVEIGSANQKIFIDQLIEKYGCPDIVIDDGSHLSSDIKDSYNLLYDKTKYCYVIEDYGTQTKNFENGIYINDNISATCIAHNRLEKLLIDKSSMTSLKVYYSICFMFK